MRMLFVWLVLSVPLLALKCAVTTTSSAHPNAENLGGLVNGGLSQKTC